MSSAIYLTLDGTSHSLGHGMSEAGGNVSRGLREGGAMPTMAAKVSLDKMACTGCGADRVLEQPCADCGTRPRPGETNAPAVRRREACRLVVTSEPHATVVVGPELPRSVTGDDLADWLSGFLADVGAIAERPGAYTAESVARRLRQLDTIRLDVEASASLRPTGMDEGLLDAVQHLERL